MIINERTEYGKQILQSLSAKLEAAYGKGWGEKQLRQCMQFATVFPDEQIEYALRRKLSWLQASIKKNVTTNFSLFFNFNQL